YCLMPGSHPEEMVIYFSGSNILFGSIFLNNAQATSPAKMTNADASVRLQSLHRLKEKYPHPKFVIPGNGIWQGVTIETTEKLLQHAVKKTSEN
ncbi:MAG TPA: hypothetical protein VMU30_12295, partial [Bacteroidota bacterium]|nr:hypothetical protein [Bacteroidota bacterium]